MNNCAIFFSLIIPVYNESEGVQGVLAESLQACEAAGIGSYEIIVVNDGSVDDTGKILEEFVATHPAMRIINHKFNKGIGAANRTGFKAARGTWIGWVPGDGQFLVKDLLQIFRANCQSAEVIIANLKPTVRVRTDGFMRHFMSRCMRLSMRLLTGTRGNMTGIYLFKKYLFDSNAPLMTTGLFNILFPYLLEQGGHSVSYQWITLYPRRTGVSKVANRKTIFKTLSEMIFFRRKYFPLLKAKRPLSQNLGVP